MKSLSILVVTSLLLISGLSQARFHRGYGKAGCGLGSMIMGRKGNQVLAATTNIVSLGNQTFGITTGTSNCGTRGLDSAMSEFIEANKVALAEDISKGEGETIVSLSRFLGCNDLNGLSDSLQKNYEHIFPSYDTSSVDIGRTIATVSAKNCSVKL